MIHPQKKLKTDRRITSYNANKKLVTEWSLMGFEVKLPPLDRNAVVGSDPSGLDEEFFCDDTQNSRLTKNEQELIIKSGEEI